VSSVILSLLKGERALCTHGRQVRDFMHIEDVASAFVALLDSNMAGVVNIGSGEPVTIRMLGSAIAELICMPNRIDFGAIEAPPNDPAVLIPDVRRLKDELGWAARFSLNHGLAQTIDWWRMHTTSMSTRA
jgi:nucleoside-diphosphate-sugar epimerase